MASTKDEAIRLIYAPNVQHNGALHTIKFLSSCFSGAAAGILGLENWQGFVLFFASLLLSAACMYVVNCKGRPAKYVPGGVRELVNPGQDNVFSFVLVWTLFFGMLRQPFPSIQLFVPLNWYHVADSNCAPLGIVHGMILSNVRLSGHLNFAFPVYD